MRKNKKLHPLFLFVLSLIGCVTAAPVRNVKSPGITADRPCRAVNLRKQYPDINFDRPAPIAAIYRQSPETIWNSTVRALLEMHEGIYMMDKNAGLIRTIKKSLNDVSLTGGGPGGANFYYALDVSIEKVNEGTQVKTIVHFWQENFFGFPEKKDLPKGAGVIRQIFYRRLDRRMQPSFVRLANDPSREIIYVKYAAMIYKPVSGEHKGQRPRKKAGPVTKRKIAMAIVPVTRIKRQYGRKVSVMLSPSARSLLIATLKGEAQVKILGKNHEWVKIEFIGAGGRWKKGWIMDRFIEKGALQGFVWHRDLK